MDPVTLIVSALAAGAASALQDDAKAALARLRTLVRERLARRPGSEFVLAQHEQAPDVYQKPLEDELEQSGAATDPVVIAAAQALMKLLDKQGSAAGKYVVNVKNSSGVQVGNHNTQVNNYGGVSAGRDAFVAGRDMNINPR
jgi:hypothetical protein